MKAVLLIGLGRFGRHIALQLNEMNHQVMAVDQDEERVNAALPFVTNAQIGDSTSEEFLSSIGVRNFDILHCGNRRQFSEFAGDHLAIEGAWCKKGRSEGVQRCPEKISAAERRG